MDSALVNRAKELVSGENQRLEDMVSKLEEHRQKLENELEQARAVRASAESAGQRPNAG